MSLANIQGKLGRSEMKNIMAGSGCYIVYSDQGYSSCWYTSGNAVDLCNSVYGSHCNATSGTTVNCQTNNCTMN